MRRRSIRSFVGTLALAAFCLSWGWPGRAAEQYLRKTDYYGRPALVLSSDVLEVTVLHGGGALASVVLKGDPERMNPLWNPLRAEQVAGRPLRPRESLNHVGHFICVDGFGRTSAEEKAAGLAFHGEAQSLPWATESWGKQGRVARLVQVVHLPRVHEILTRTLTLVDGEQVVYAHQTLESLLDFDRPILWAEHATIGAPFLEQGVTVLDMSKNRALTHPHAPERRQRLVPDKEFSWPMAPSVRGGVVDLRVTPTTNDSTDLTGHLMDTGEELGFVTALHPKKRLLLGYVFKTSQFAWMQCFENYTPEIPVVRAFEFSTQPFVASRRDVISRSQVFGKPIYRWLPARSKIEGNYLLFWTRTPEGFQGVDRVQLKNGKLEIFDRRSGKTITLEASQPL